MEKDIPQKTKEPSYDPAILLMDVYPEKTIIPDNTCPLMSTITLFTIARIWKQYKYPSAEEWIRIWHIYTMEYSVQFSSVAQSCPTLCVPMNHSMPGLPAHYQLLEFTQTHVRRVGDAIQPSHLLSSPSPPALNLS